MHVVDLVPNLASWRYRPSSPSETEAETEERKKRSHGNGTRGNRGAPGRTELEKKTEDDVNTNTTGRMRRASQKELV